MNKCVVCGEETMWRIGRVVSEEWCPQCETRVVHDGATTSFAPEQLEFHFDEEDGGGAA